MHTFSYFNNCGSRKNTSLNIYFNWIYLKLHLSNEHINPLISHNPVSISGNFIQNVIWTQNLRICRINLSARLKHYISESFFFSTKCCNTRQSTYVTAVMKTAVLYATIKKGHFKKENHSCSSENHKIKISLSRITLLK